MGKFLAKHEIMKADNCVDSVENINAEFKIEEEDASTEQISVVNTKNKEDPIKCSRIEVAIAEESCQPGTSSNVNCIEEPLVQRNRIEDNDNESTIEEANINLEEVPTYMDLDSSHLFKLPPEVSRVYLLFIQHGLL